MSFARVCLLLSLLSLPLLLTACPGNGGGDPTPTAPDSYVVKVPLNTLSFFAGEQCPDGWTRHEPGKGRLLVGVTDPTSVGNIVGEPMVSGELRTHDHDYDVDVTIDPIGGVLGISGCCANTVAAAGDHQVSGLTEAGEPMLPLIEEVLCEKTFEEAGLWDTDPFPADTVMFFARESCPLGWMPFEEGAGRLVAAVPDAGEVGTMVGTPLTDSEDRTHVHDFNAQITLPERNLVGLAGGNTNPGYKGTYDIVGPTEENSSDLPYLQALICRDTIDPDPQDREVIGDRILPGSLSFFAGESCPEGWSLSEAHQGRFLMALMDGGVAGTTVGDPLTPGEDRAHTHDIDGQAVIPNHPIALATGCCYSQPGHEGSYAFATTSEPASTNMPYINLLGCTKN